MIKATITRIKKAAWAYACTALALLAIAPSASALTSQTITFGAIASQPYGNAPFTISATASSGLPVTFSATGASCTVSGNTVTILAVGTCHINANQTGNATYAAAAQVQQPFIVTLGAQSITFPVPANMNLGGANQTLTATASSGLAVIYTVQTPSVCHPVGQTGVQAVATGTCTIAANQSGNSNYSAAAQVTQSFQILGTAQTITFAALSNKVYGTAPFAVSGTASSSLAVTFSSGTPATCTVSGNTVTLVAGGLCSVVANQAGNSTYAAAPAVTQSFTITPAAQSISFAALSNKVYGSAPFAVSASASSGLAVAFTSGTTAICTVSGNTVTIVNGGTCTINANQAGNASYSAATQASQTFTVTPAPQSITFNAPTNVAYGTPVALTASATSGLGVTYTSNSTGICTVSGSTLTPVVPGTCSVTASQAGNANYAAASTVTQSFNVAQAPQTISFAALANKAFGSAPFTVNASASSGLGVTFSSSTTGICTASGSTVNIVAGGTCTINANQSGNANYTAAAQVAQSFTVTPLAQSITFTAPGNVALGAPVALSASATSGLAVSFTSSTTSVCTVSGTTLTPVSAGTCTIAANQAGNANYSAAPQATQTFNVGPQSQSISFAALAAQSFGTAPFAVSATASSGLAVAFTSTTTPVCTVSGSTVTLVAVGTCSIAANQAGNANYTAAAQVVQSFAVNKGAQTISFAALANQSYGVAPIALSASASSGLAVAFNSTTTPVCTVSGSTVTVVTTGQCSITANQSGNGNYNAATAVVQSFNVGQGAQSIGFAALANQTFGSAPFALNASASSGLAVTFGSATTGICTVSGSTVTIVAGGTCTINANQAGNANYAAAAQVSQTFTVTPAAQSITFNAPANVTFGTPATLTASATSGLAVSFTSSTTGICTVSGNTLTPVAAGTCTIVANQAGNANYAAANAVTLSFAIGSGPQTISFAALTNKAYGSAPFAVSASASSGLAVTFASGTSAICTVSGSTVTIVAGGTCTINANQAGNANYAAAAQVSQTFTVTPAAQSITFNAPANVTFGTPATLTASVTSGLAVSFTSSTTGICTVSGNTLTPVAAGTCTIVANQAGNTNYAAANAVTQSFAIGSGPQTISFAALTNKAYGSAPFAVSASASSGLAVTFASGTSAICTVSGSTVTIVAGGVCTINANQAGNANYAAAAQVSQTFTVTPAAQSITFNAPANVTFGTPATLTASATSGLAVSFTSSTTGICTVSGNTLTPVAAGTCTIAANQAGNANYSAAPQVSLDITIATAPQTITFAAPANVVFGTSPTLSASATSGLPVSFASSTGAVCTVTGNVLTPVTAGNCTIVASQAGNGNYSAATTVTQTFAIAQASQTINFTAPLSAALGGAPVALNATATSGLSVSFVSNTSSICTVSGNVATLLQTGTCTIVASQAGNGNYAAAAPVSQNITVTGALWNNSPWITLGMPSRTNWNADAYGNGTFVAVAWGFGNAGYTTDGGATWKQSTLPGSLNWANIGYGNGFFIAVAHDTSTYAISPDGINWMSYNFPVSANWNAITYGNGRFVAVAAGSNTAAMSTDGVHWTAATLPASATWSGISFGNGSFVAVSNGSATNAVSSDGLNWTAGTMPVSAGWGGIAYGQGKFVAVAYNSAIGAISPDGLNWTQTSMPQSANWAGLAYGNGLFVTVAGNDQPGTIGATSEDGINWTNSTMPANTFWSDVAYGNNQFVAVAGGGQTTIAGSLTRTEITPPTVSLISPTAGQSFAATAPINLSANASATNTGVAQVQYFNGPTLIGTATQAPYTLIWNNAPAGVASITAVVTDSAGGSATSAAVLITVGNAAGTPVDINLTSSSAGQTMTAPAALTLTANVTDSSATINQVAFYNGNTLLATVYQAPYTLTMPNVAPGTYSFTAQTFDSQGASAASAPVAVTVLPANPLSVNLINAGFSANPAGTTYALTQAFPAVSDNSEGSLAMDQQGNAYYAAWSKGYVLQIKPDGTAGMQWNGLNTPTGPAVAKDGSGVLVGSAAGLMHLGFDGSIATVNPNTDLGRPYYAPNGVLYCFNGGTNTVYQLNDSFQESIYLPSNTLVGVHGMAFDSNGNMILAVYTSNQIVRVNADKSIDQLLSYGGPLAITPYGQGWLMGTVNGAYLVDGQWQTVTQLSALRSDTVVVLPNGNVNIATWNSAGVQQLAPHLSAMQTSGSNAIAINAQGSLMLAATTMDGAAQVSQVGFYANGTLLGSITPGPYTLNWNYFVPGTYVVTAQASDTAGNSATSQPINLTVAGPIITNPTAGQIIHTPASLVLSATATSLAGTITQVRYFDNGALVGTATQAPYSYSWSNIPGGTHTLTAVATDSAGNILSSAPVSFTVEALPTVTLTTPKAGTMTGDNFALTADAGEVGGTIAQVAFYNGTNLLGTATQTPYGIVFKDIAAGTYVLTAQATDSFGQVATSAAVTVTVVANSGGGAGGEVVYDIHTDQLNTPRMITDQSGNVVWQWNNDDAFGNNLPIQDPNGNGNQFVFNLRLSHQYADIETGTNYNYFRDFDPATGRYLESDPIGLRGGQSSTYAYVYGRPSSFVDPFGLGGELPDFGSSIRSPNNPVRQAWDAAASYVQNLYPDYASVSVSYYVGSGGGAINLKNGEMFGQWSLARVYPAYSTKPGVCLSVGHIIGGADAQSTSDFLKGGGLQATTIIPVDNPVFGVGGGLNHSYGGATSVEFSVGTAGTSVTPISYGFPIKK